jgi:hypothetical protein
MSHSAIEIEFLKLIKNTRLWLKSHDRGVMFGVVLSSIPLPPISILGILVGMANLFLIETSRLNGYEKKLVWYGILIAIVNTILMIILTFQFFQIAKSMDLKIIQSALDQQITILEKIAQWYINWVEQFSGTKRETI